MKNVKNYAALLFAPLVLAASPATTPQEYYARALSTMRAAPQPATVTVSVTAVGDGIGVLAGPSTSGGRAGYAQVQAGSGISSRTASWSETYHAATDSASVDTPAASSLVGIGPLFNPTWTGAYDWLRYGLDGRPHENAVQPMLPASAQLKVIATVAVMAPSAYRVSDAGPQQCPDGSAGHHLQFAAKGDWTEHPLTDVVVDEGTMHFCSVRFRIDPKHIHGATGTVRIDYASRNGYWLETHSRVDVSARLFGIAVGRAGVDFTYHVTRVQ